MKKNILIRHGEIHLKGKNIALFEGLLQKNILRALRGIKCRFVKLKNRYLVEDFLDEDCYEITERLKKVFGIHSFSVALKVKSDLNEIFNASLELLGGRTNATFRFDTNRANKTFPLTSVEVSRELGGMMLSKFNQMRVDLFNAEVKFFVDIREGGESFVYNDSVLGAGGLPVGSSASGLVLLSGGIDSPVATHMMAKRGMVLSALHFHSFPHTSPAAQEKVKELARTLSPYLNGIELIMINLADIQTSINRYAHDSFGVALTRKVMMRIANQLALSRGLGAIITGESLGQVASQTLESLTVTQSEAQVPILRPLIGFDKSEIIERAIKINTYNISIMPHDDCCTVFLPQKPVIKPKLEKAIEEEKRVLNLDEMIKTAISNAEIILL